MAKKMFTKKAASHDANYRQGGTRGKARRRKNYNGLLKQMRKTHQTMVKESLSALCHATI